jgi:hypothetical protein
VRQRTVRADDHAQCDEGGAVVQDPAQFVIFFPYTAAVNHYLRAG